LYPARRDASITVWSAVTAVTAFTVSASPEHEVKAVTAVTALHMTRGLPAHLDEGFEDVERKLLGVDDLTEVVQRRAALPDVVHVDVVLAQKLVGLVLGHE
jgi:hypothetical protein